MARMSQLAGFDRVIGFDMGGTSTDVSHFAGEYERVFTSRIAGVRLRAPMLDIHTVAAGGGSVLHFDGSRYRVGPDSAGADPGPACYRGGGPLAVTDANVMLGRIQPAHFPAGVRPRTATSPSTARSSGTASPPSRARSASRPATTARPNRSPRVPADRRRQHRHRREADLRPEGPRRHPLRPHHLRRRRRPARLHGRRLARHPHRPRAAHGRCPLRARHRPRRHHGHARAVRRGTPGARLDARRPQDRRRPGSGRPRRTPRRGRPRGAHRGHPPRPAALRRHRHHPHRRAHRARHDAARLRRTSSRHVLLHARPPDRRRSPLRRSHRHHRTPRSLRSRPLRSHPRRQPRPHRETVRLHTGGAWRDVPLHRREDLPPGDTVTGPAIITEASATTVVDDGWRAAATDDGHLVMERAAITQSSDLDTKVDPVLLEVFNNLFMSIAEQMGARLESTAQSVNIKERLDFSCALFDPDGNLVANAPHIPVHLGSMGTSVKEVIRRRGSRMRPGDTYAVNDPYHGGTHLPDVTVITPVFDTATRVCTSTEGDAGRSSSTSPHAATTPRSAASPPAPCPRTAAPSRRRASSSTTGCSPRTAASARTRPSASSPRRRTPPATRRPTSPTCAPRSPPTTRASTRSAA